ncbi:MAG: hypothetical protein DBX59_03180 [Bacillota bacterium]|nr:MAG: hypothetical protein DBX59_03180 [Bacillota bacterium]
MKSKKRGAARFAAAVLLALACVFAGCAGGVDLETGAKIVLKIETTAEHYEVSATYGTVQLNDGGCEILLDCKKNVFVTVSAENYRSANVRVTVAQLADGEHEQTVRLTDKIGKNLQISVSGITKGLRGECGGKAFEARNSILYGEFSEEELLDGVTITADGAEPCVYAFRPEQIRYQTIMAEVRLVPEGKRLVRPFVWDDYYATDAYGRYLPTNGSDVVLDKSYRGTVYVWSTYFDMGKPTTSPPTRYDIDENTPAYPAISTYGTATYREKYRITGVNEEQCEAWEFAECIYYETDGQLYKSDFEYERDDFAVDTVNAVVEKFWLIDFEENSFRSAVPDANREVRFSDFLPEPCEPAYMLYDAYLDKLIVDTRDVQIKYYSGLETVQKTVTMREGVIDKADVGMRFLHWVSFDGGTWAECSVRYYCVKKGDKICMVLDFLMPLTYEMSLADERGAAVSGAVLEGVNAEETDRGRYAFTVGYRETRLIRVITQETAYFVRVDSEDRVWTFDEAARKFSAKITLYDTGGFLMLLNFRPEQLKIECDDPAFSFHKIEQNLYYVHAPMTGEAEVAFSVFDYAGYPVMKTKTYTLSVGSIMKDYGKVVIDL